MIIISANIILATQISTLSMASEKYDPFAKIQPTSSYMLAEHHGGHGMNKMDTNGDGEVSKDEFMAHKEMRFMMKDKNGDGKLTTEEMKMDKGKHGKHNCNKKEG
jgi:hypothetical protein